jgi:hypothetical protein
MKNVLLTSLSTKAQNAIYSLYGKTVAANQSPLALIQLLPPERLPREIIVLCTEKLMVEQFREDYALLDEKKLGKIRKRWAEIKDSLDDVEKWRLDLAYEKIHGPDEWIPAGERLADAKGGILLVSPLGLSKGLLYSALYHVRPGSLLVISSPDAAAYLDEIVEKAGWSGNKIFHLMRDPHGGFNELEIFLPDIVSVVIQADEVMVNITGGTTAMQHIMQHIADFAAKLGRSVQRMALVDRRSPQEQRDDPYLPGELIFLDQKRRN